MASRGTPQYQQVGQYGHKIGKAPAYYRSAAYPASTTLSYGALYGPGAGTETISLAKYDLFVVAAKSSASKAVTASTQLKVPTAPALAKALPTRPAVGDYLEFTIVNAITGVTAASTNNKVQFVMNATSASNGWSAKMGAKRTVVLQNYNGATATTHAPSTLRVRAVWTSVTPGSETLDYMFV